MFATGRDWLESVTLLLSVSERDRVDVMVLGGAKINIMYSGIREKSTRLKSTLA